MNKTAGKNKGKTSDVEALTYGKRADGPKPLQFGKSGKLHGLNSKPGVAVGKKAAAYTSQSPPASQFHEAGYGIGYAVGAGTMSETTPLEREAELADELVAEVADDNADVRELCETYELKREELGRLTGFSLRALAAWAGGELPSQPAKRRLREVRRLLDALSEIVRPESIPKWLHQRNPAFDQLTPLQVIELGEIDRLWAMVHDLGSGQPG
jgi:DNA-binding transcriptional regulator YiaG